MDAARASWPSVAVLFLKGPESSDPRSVGHGYPAWAYANEMVGSFFVGMVESAYGTSALVIDGGEVYLQRTQAEFTDWYNWMKTGIALNGGPIVPSGAVTSQIYNATVNVANQVYDRDYKDTAHSYPVFPASTLASLLTMSRNATDKYHWLYSESCDAIGGNAATRLPACSAAWLAAVRGAVK